MRGMGKYLAPGDRAIRLFGNAESIKAISLKLRALDREGAEIKNVLIILDRASLSHFELLTGPSNILPSAISGRSVYGSVGVHTGIRNTWFLFPYLKYRITGKVELKMKRMNPYGRIRDSKNNDAFNPREKQIEQEGEAYWKIVKRVSRTGWHGHHNCSRHISKATEGTGWNHGRAAPS